MLIALNFGARFFAILLILFVIAATFYYHDFWNQTGAINAKNNMIHALKNLSIIGALFIVAGIGTRPRGSSIRLTTTSGTPKSRRHAVTRTSWRGVERLAASRGPSIHARPEVLRRRSGTPGKHPAAGQPDFGACDSQNVS